MFTILFFFLLANPFYTDVDDISVELQMVIKDLQFNDILKNSFRQSPLFFFSSKFPLSYSKIRNISAKYSKLFVSTYVYEQENNYRMK